VATGGPPPNLGGVFPARPAGRRRSGMRMPNVAPPLGIDSSVGTFDTPNPFEAKAAQFLLQDLARPPRQRRPLLVVAGQSGPSRRFLRALGRQAPDQARRCVVATGDAIPFNTVYRDRRVAWPIQDLPFTLVFFCHRNPVDGETGFRPGRLVPDDSLGAASATGTEDVLLYGDVIEALVLAGQREGPPCADAAELGRRLAAMSFRDGRLRDDPAGQPLLFDSHGNRNSGTGAHVVCLRPRFQGNRVLPEATIEAAGWGRNWFGAAVWKPARDPLRVTYQEVPDDALADGGDAHD
jgi:hypothetical protein